MRACAGGGGSLQLLKLSAGTHSLAPRGLRNRQLLLNECQRHELARRRRRRSVYMYICIYVYTIYIHAGGQRVAACARCVPLTCSSCSSKSPSPVAAQAAAMRSAWGEPSAATRYVLHATYAARATRCNATLSRCNSDVCRHAGDRHLVGGARCRLQRAQLRCCSADGK